MKAAVVTLNIALHFALAVVLIWIVSWFYLGNEITYQNLQNHQLLSFLLRLAGGILFGICGQIIILIIDVVYNITRRNKADKLSIKKILMMSTICNILSSLVGTIIFFSNWVR